MVYEIWRTLKQLAPEAPDQTLWEKEKKEKVIQIYRHLLLPSFLLRWNEEEKKKSYVSLNINICKQGERTPFHAQVDPRDLYDVLNLYGLCTCVFVLFCFVFSSRRSVCSKTETQRENHWYKLYRTLWNPKGILIVFVLLDPGVTSI